MYLVGAAHPHRADARQLLEDAIAASQRLITSAEVLQEILHRYVAIVVRANIERIMTFDTAFDRIPGISRYRT